MFVITSCEYFEIQHRQHQFPGSFMSSGGTRSGSAPVNTRVTNRTKRWMFSGDIHQSKTSPDYFLLVLESRNTGLCQICIYLQSIWYISHRKTNTIIYDAYIYIQGLILFVPVDVLTPNKARPSAGTVQCIWICIYVYVYMYIYIHIYIYACIKFGAVATRSMFLLNSTHKFRCVFCLNN